VDTTGSVARTEVPAVPLQRRVDDGPCAARHVVVPALPADLVPAPGRDDGGRRRTLAAGFLLALSVAVLAAVPTVLRPAPLGEVRAVEAAAPAAAGWGANYVDDRGRPARWDPCRPIGYVVNEGWMPPGGRADLAVVLQRLGAASGLRFVDEGSTDEVPARGRPAFQPERYGERWAPLLIAWVPPSSTDLPLGEGVQGATMAVAMPSGDGPSLVSGQVAIDADSPLPDGFGPGVTDGEVLAHELGHAVGLGHVLDPTQVMYPQTTDGESAYGAGDRAGLAAVGAAAGCHRAPPAEAVRQSAG